MCVYGEKMRMLNPTRIQLPQCPRKRMSHDLCPRKHMSHELSVRPSFTTRSLKLTSNLSRELVRGFGLSPSVDGSCWKLTMHSNNSNRSRESKWSESRFSHRRVWRRNPSIAAARGICRTAHMSSHIRDFASHHLQELTPQRDM